MTEHTFVTGILNAARLILLIIYALLLTIIIGCIQLVTLAITHIRKKTNPLHPAKKYSDISPSTFHLNIHVFCTGHYKPPLPTNRNPPYTQTTCPWRISSA